MSAPLSAAQRRLVTRLSTKVWPAFGLGGASWDAYAPAGDGVTANRTYALAGTWDGYVLRQVDTRPAQAGPAVAAGVETWGAYGLSADVLDGAGAAVDALEQGWIIVSRAEATRAYLIGAPVDVAGYARWDVTPTAAP